MSDWAPQAARRGAVVDVPNWIRIREGTPLSSKALRATLVGMVGDIAAAVQLSRGTGESYGGDPDDLTLFGHSSGAMGATMEALGRAPPQRGVSKASVT